MRVGGGITGGGSTNGLVSVCKVLSNSAGAVWNLRIYSNVAQTVYVDTTGTSMHGYGSGEIPANAYGLAFKVAGAWVFFVDTIL
jgi:hypothetical protein